MVQLMKNGESASQNEKVAPVKMEVDDSLEEEHGPLNKRPKARFSLSSPSSHQYHYCTAELISLSPLPLRYASAKRRQKTRVAPPWLLELKICGLRRKIITSYSLPHSLHVLSISGSLNMVQTRFQRIDDMFEMVRWSSEEEKFMVDMLIEYAGNKKLFGDDYKVSALTSIASQLTVGFNRTFSYLKVEKKFKSLHDRFKLWDVITYWPGVRLDLTTRKWETTPSTWEAIIKEHPAAKRLMTEGEKLGIELSVIFARHAESEYQKQAYAELEKLERGFGILKNDRGSEDSFSDKNSFIKKDGVAPESSGRFLGANSHGHDAGHKLATRS